jgi:uncharacterized protein (TIGR02996 family)
MKKPVDADERALLAAIAAHPEEDTPRLVYADWLQEHDCPELAQYIRLSIQLANLRYGDPKFDSEERRLVAERRPLEPAFEAWEKEFVRQFPATRELYWHTERGMISGVCCSVKYFLDNGDRILKAVPLRWFMPASLTTTTAKRLVKHPLFARLKELRVPLVKNAPAILDCDEIAVESLSFSVFLLFTRGEWDVFAVLLSGHDGLTIVKHIGFENCGLTDPAGEALAAAPHLNPDALNLLSHSFTEPVQRALRKRYGKRVWLNESDRADLPRG